MKVAVIMPLAEQRGGGELMLEHLLQQGQRDDICWCVIFLQDGPMVNRARALGAETHVVEMGRLRYLHRTLRAVRRIAVIAREFQADVILGWMAMGHIYGSLATKMLGVPAVWYQLGTANASWGLDRAATCLPSCGIMVCSQNGMEAQAKLRPARHLRVVYPGAELARFAPDSLPGPTEARKRLNLPLEGPLIGIVGRLQRWKGMHTLIEAMPSILMQYPDAHAVVVGGVHAPEPDYLDYLQQRIIDLHLKDRVLMVGLQRNIPEWMQAMDVIVHASDCEPFGIVIIEAMALGKPVVAGSKGGPTEIITDGVNGLLAPYGDSETLARCILRYLNDRVFMTSVGAKARTRALEFSTQRYAANVIDAVQDFLSIAEKSSAVS